MTIELLTPGEALAKLTPLNAKKYEREEKQYNDGKARSAIHVEPLRIDRKPFSVQFKAVLDCDRILVNQFDGKSSFSLYVIPESESDIAAFESLNEMLVQNIKQLQDYDLTSSWKDDRLHIKLKYTPGTLQSFVTSNIPINLKKPHEFKIHHGQQVTVTGSLHYYYNFENSMAGTTFSVTNLEFET